MGGGAHHHPSAQHRVYVKLKHTSALVEVKVVKSTKIQGGFIASARATSWAAHLTFVHYIVCHSSSLRLVSCYDLGPALV